MPTTNRTRANTYTPRELVGKTIVSRRSPGAQRRVDKVSANGRYIETVPVTGSGRRSTISIYNLADYDVVHYVNTPASARSSRPAAKPAATAAAIPLARLSDRERELLRIIKKKFGQFNQRQQHTYLLNGMSTTHVGWSMFADADAVRLFWPKELVRTRLGGTTYVMEGDFGKRIQATVTETLKKLNEKGHLEKLGNKDERRWKPTYAA